MVPLSAEGGDTGLSGSSFCVYNPGRKQAPSSMCLSYSFSNWLAVCEGLVSKLPHFIDRTTGKEHKDFAKDKACQVVCMQTSLRVDANDSLNDLPWSADCC